MAENIIKVRQKQRIDKESNWAAQDPVLLEGELAFSSDKDDGYKIGNGKSKWSELSYAKARVEKSDLGLENVDNTADKDKSVKYATSAESANTLIGGSATSSGNRHVWVSSTTNDNRKTTTDKFVYDATTEMLTTNISGNSESATKLKKVREISLSNGASGVVNFDGSQNVSIPVNSVKEAYLSWGGKNLTGTYGCIDAVMIPDLGANRMAFGKAAGITVEYSRDSGTTWVDYGSSDVSRIGLFGIGNTHIIGKADSSNKATSEYMLRVIVDTDKFNIYTVLNKFAIYISTNGSSGCYCTIDASLESTPTTWKVFADKVPISGWSGWNVINTSSITTYGNSASGQYGLLRFTFGCTSGSTTYNGLQIIRIMGFGGVGWNTPSNMAKYGSIYSYDNNQNVSFPNQVTASYFNGTSTSSEKLTTSAGSATQPVYFFDGKPVATTYTLGKSVPSNAVFTDTNNKMTQTVADSTNYTNWRPLLIGSSNSATEGFIPTTVTDGAYVFPGISVQPSTGTIKATTFKGNASSATTVNGHTVNSDVPSGAKFTDTVYSHPTSSGNKHIPSGGSAGQILRWSADGTAVWGADNNTTYSDATQSTHGLMSVDDKKKLDGIASGATAVTDSTVSGWGYKKTDTNTWIALKGATTSAAGTAGYAPAPSAGAANRYLRSDGTWAVPPDTNTTYSVASSSSNGLMSASDKAKLDGIGGITTISKTLTVGTDWIDTGISASNIPTEGSYVVQISGMSSSATTMYSEVFTGFMSWYPSATNSTESCEVLLHNAGHASNNTTLFLRTVRVATTDTAIGYLKLQIASNRVNTSSNYTFKFRKLI